MDLFSPRSGERRSEDGVIVELYGGKQQAFGGGMFAFVIRKHQGKE